MSQALINKLLAQRETWVEVEPGKRIKVRRPVEVEMVELRLGVTRDHLKRYAIDWEGMTEADILGSTVGTDTPIPFSTDVCDLVLSDRSEWFMAVASGVSKAVTEHLKKKAEAEKN